jgi:CubicO group peptidase (beta-lactamase class C family)
VTPEDVVAAATRDWARSGAAGGVVALFAGGRIGRHWCLGLADIEGQRGWTLDTPTRLASLSKHVTAAAFFAQGLDAGRALGSWLPELQGPVGATTVSRALTMTSGIPDLAETLALAGVPGSPAFGAERLHGLSCRLGHLNFPSGEEISYSNTNFRLVQRAIERAGGTGLADWLDAHFFAPLGLRSFALVEDQSVCVPGLAAGYWHADGAPRRGNYGLHYSGSGGMVASAADLARWMHALLEGRGALSGIFSRLAEPGRLASGATTGYAHGLMLHRLGARVVVGHAGSLPGYKNHVLLDPATGRGALVLSNREETAAQALALALLAADLGLAQPGPAPDSLPAGMFVDPDTGDMLELARGAGGPTVSFLGAEEPLHVAADGAWETEAPYLPIRIVPVAASVARIEASVGGAAPRNWRRADGAAGPARAGLYRCAALDATHEIALVDGVLAIRWGSGPAAAGWERLRPGTAGAYAAATPANGPSRLRPALRFDDRGFVLSSNRSRRWRFERG